MTTTLSKGEKDIMAKKKLPPSEDASVDIKPFEPPIDILIKGSQPILKKDRIDEVAYSTLDSIAGEFKEEYRKLSKRDIKRKMRHINESYKKQYTAYMKGGYKEKALGLKSYNPYKYKAQYLRQLNNRVDTALGLIVNHHQAYMLEIVNRYKEWFSIDSPDVRGDKATPEAFSKKLSAFCHHDKDKFEKHMKFVIKDQSNKLSAALDEITASQGGAFAMIWKTRNDKRVVGNPSGLYPKGAPIHGNHYVRNNKLFLLKNSWALKEGYIKKTKGVEYLEDLPDGKPSDAIGCRCFRIDIYSLEDIPNEYHFILTKKGKAEIGE